MRGKVDPTSIPTEGEQLAQYESLMKEIEGMQNFMAKEDFIDHEETMRKEERREYSRLYD